MKSLDLLRLSDAEERLLAALENVRLSIAAGRSGKPVVSWRAWRLALDQMQYAEECLIQASGADL